MAVFLQTEQTKKNNKPSSRRWWLLLVALAAFIFSIRNLSGVSKYIPVDEWSEYMPVGNWTMLLDAIVAPTTSSWISTSPPSKITIGYAVSITGCPKSEKANMLDSAAVVHQSIRLASLKSNYDYHIMAFVHPEAESCGRLLEPLGYEIQIRDTPFNESEIRNEQLLKAQSNSCCGSKEYLKLYSYVQFQYPVVVHLDLDCLVLRPLDDIFDLMLDDPALDKSRIPAMWLTPDQFPESIDFVFTRDYGMVDPPRRQPHQIGVQGGFLVVKPNQTDFDRNVEIILSGGDFAISAGWGGKAKKYGGYYGAGTIQGLASYYYGEFAQNRSLELNRCYYDNMVDDPYFKGDQCRTLQSQCQDCRKTQVTDIYLTHFTNCGKPFWCAGPVKLWANEQDRLCMELFREWHLVRLSLENEWKSKYPDYSPVYAPPPPWPNSTKGYRQSISQGHCGGNRRYIPMKYPAWNSGGGSVLPKGQIPLLHEAGGLKDNVTDKSSQDAQADGTQPSNATSLLDNGKASGPVQIHEPHTVPIAKKTKIAYAVSVTGCNLTSNPTLLDGAAVVHQSIRLASANSSYGYHMIAFVHPDAAACTPYLSHLGYEIQVRDTPFNISAIRNPDLILAQGNSCCGEKEYLKLYSYLQLDYPVVVHLDLDTIVLKPMDDVFDLMLKPSFNRSKLDVMWLKPEEFPERVDFLFTRDYNMVDPPYRQPHQIGVQGGFLVVRPNATDFKRYVDIILTGGNYDLHAGWGGEELSFGGYYGAGTIQGLASYYYGHFEKNRSVELNRCYYDAMVDNPMGPDITQRDSGVERCRTLEETCQDCRKVNLEEIFTAHFTVCGKPFWCQSAPEPLCMRLHRVWHTLRLSLEDAWAKEYPGYEPARAGDVNDFERGHCDRQRYLPLKLPADPTNTSATSFM